MTGTMWKSVTGGGTDRQWHSLELAMPNVEKRGAKNEEESKQIN